MGKIVISGYYGFANAGDEAMLAAMIEALTEVEPRLRIAVISGAPEDTRRRHGVDAVFRLNYAQIIRSLRRSDLLVSGGGSLLQDVTSDRSLYYYLSIVLLAKALGKRVMLYAQGIGPVRGAAARAAVRCICNIVDCITVRDIGSRDELQMLGVTKPPVYVTADPVMAMHPVDKQLGRAILRRSGLEGATPLVGFSVREWKDWAPYKQVLALTADRIVEEFGARIVFLPMQQPDVATAEKIAGLMTQPATVLTDEFGTNELLSLVGNLTMMVGIRLHALIFAAIMQVPLIGVSYDPKVAGFLESIGETPAGTLATVSAEDLLAKVRELWPDGGQAQTRQNRYVSVLRERAFHNAELAVALLENKARR